MKPILLTCGPFHLYSYGLCIAVGVLLALFLMKRQSLKEGFLETETLFDIVSVVLIWGFSGARLFYVAQNFSYYWASPLKIFALWEGGLIFYGGAVAAVTGFWVFTRRRKLPFWRTLDFIIPYGVLTHAFGRIGCFLNGCCYGKRCDLPWGVKFPSVPYPVHPTQLYESFFDLVLFLFLSHRQKQPHSDGQISLFYFILYGMGRFSIEFLREPTYVWWGLTSNQWLSLLIMIAAFAVFKGKQKPLR